MLVKKRGEMWHFCIDLCKVNAATHQDAYPLPRIDKTLDSLAHAIMFTTLDLASGYWQVELDKTSKEKTTFHLLEIIRSSTSCCLASLTPLLRFNIL